MIAMTSDWGKKKKKNRTQVLVNAQWLAAQEYLRDYLKGGQLARVPPAARPFENVCSSRTHLMGPI